MIVLDVPEWVSEFLSKLKLSWHQLRLTSRYVTGLIASTKKSVSNIASIFKEGSSKALNRMLTEYSFDTKKFNEIRLKELQNYNETRWSKHGVAIIDDTILEKTGKKIEAIAKHWDHAKKRFVFGHQIVTLHYVDRKTSYAIDYKLYLKDKESKIKLAKSLVEEAIAIGMPANTFIFDSWYFCREFVDFLESKGKNWIAACKSDRLIKYKGSYLNLKEYSELIKESFNSTSFNGKKIEFFAKNFYFKSLRRKAKLVIFFDGKDFLFLVTNLNKHAIDLLNSYSMRSKIDTFYKD